MGTQFKRLKQYNATWTVVRALAFGVSAFLLLSGVFLLLDKLRLLQLGAISFVIGAAGGIAVGIAMLLILRKTDLRLAEKIDREQKLRERVQTMVAYQEDDGAVVQLQRQDTEERLKQVRTVGMRAQNVAVYAAVFVVAFAVFMVSLILPARAVAGPTMPPTQPTEPLYEATPWQKAALEELIEHVQDSAMVDAVKTPVVEELTQLRQLLDTPVRVSVVRANVIEAMSNAYKITDENNSHDDMHQVLSLMSHKIRAYLCYCLGNLALDDYDEKMDMAQALLQADMVSGTATFSGIGAEVLAALKMFEFREEDALYLAVQTFGNEMVAAGAAQDQNNVVDAKRLMGEAIYNLRSNASTALNQQWLNKEEALYVVKTLGEIFGISPNEMPRDPDREYPLDTSETPPESSGGGGDGKMEYPSDDKVYDYKNNQHVPYFEILQEYYDAMANDAMDGKFDPELEDFIRKYFGNLQRVDGED